MTAIQAVFVRGHESRSSPKPHTVYRIEIQAHVRSWHMWRRYSEFVDLHAELVSATGVPPPSPLPPKHSFSLVRSFKNEKLIEERRAGLETYLRAIVSAKEDIWRECYAFRAFLGVPVGRQAGPSEGSSSLALTGGGAQFTSSTWLDEHLSLQSLIRDIRADINRRDALADRGDVAGSRTASVQAKKSLAEALGRVRALAEGLQDLGQAGMSEGEMQRRTDMVGRVQDDCEKLGQMVMAARQSAARAGAGRGGGGLAPEQNIASDVDRAALLGPAATSRPVTRVFGAAVQPVETDQTRPLDDQGVFQLQKVQMMQQDSQLAQLGTILQRQRQLGQAINEELRLHNELLDDLSNDVDRTGAKLTSAHKQLRRLG